MDWEKLKAFHVVASSGGFSKAVSTLNLSQSAISRQVQDLENRLQVPLFQRHARGVILTEAGKSLLKAVNQVYKILDQAESDIKNYFDEPAGPLRVASYNSWFFWIMADIASFLGVYPSINLKLFTVPSDSIDFNNADVGVFPYISDKKNLVQKYLFKMRYGLYASKEYIAEHGEPKTLDDLKNHKLIAITEEEKQYNPAVDWHLKLMKEKFPDFNHDKIHFLCNSLVVITKLIEQGTGIFSLSNATCRCSNMNLVRILPELEGPSTDIYYTYQEELSYRKPIVVFEEYLINLLKNKGLE